MLRRPPDPLGIITLVHTLQSVPGFRFPRALVIFVLLISAILGISAETPVATDPADTLPDAPAAQTRPHDAVTLRSLPLNVLKDQGVIWTAPIHLKPADLKVVLPFLAATGAAIATDRRALEDVVSHDPSFNNDNTNASNVLIGGFIAAPVILWGAGHLESSEHARETGLLGAEALADGVILEQGMKLIFWRERPNQGNGHGDFFQTSAGLDSSFPSSHSVLAWGTAAVLAGEYRNPWAQALVYGGAASVSVTRVLGQQHFPSDVLVGSTLGWFMGHYIYKHRHRWTSTHRITRD